MYRVVVHQRCPNTIRSSEGKHNTISPGLWVRACFSNFITSRKIFEVNTRRQRGFCFAIEYKPGYYCYRLGFRFLMKAYAIDVCLSFASLTYKVCKVTRGGHGIVSIEAGSINTRSEIDRFRP